MLKLFEENPCIHNDKVILRRPCADDLESLSALFDAPLDSSSTKKMLKEFERAWDEGSEYILVIVSAKDSRLRGIIEVYSYDGEKVMIGYRIKKDSRNQGYAKEAVYLLSKALINDMNIEEIYALTKEDNIASMQLLRHNGYEQIARQDQRILFVCRRKTARQPEMKAEDGKKMIWCAGGCFWGAEKAFRMLDGVTDTKTGYANGNTDNPGYEDVCRGDTGYRETVQITYDPEIVSLQTILRAFFLCIDPTVSNRQGNDIGSQYQTGVYYTDPQDGKVISDFFEEEKTKHKRFCVELSQLKNFWLAEEYHQKYLDRFPDGYCHITPVEFEKVRALNRHHD